MSEWDFTESDFSVEGLSEDQQQYWHTHLSCRLSKDSLLTLEVKSKKSPVWYPIRHDMVMAESGSCPCEWTQYHAFCKSHVFRAQLVLERRLARLAEQPLTVAEKPATITPSEQREQMPLNGNRNFRLLR